MTKKIITLFISCLILLSCSNDKKKNLKNLNTTITNIELALKSNDREFILKILSDIEFLLPIYDEHQSLREKKYILEIRIKEYKKAINTIDGLLLLSPEDIDNRIVQGILLEIVGSKAQSVKVLEEALSILERKIKRMHPSAKKKKVVREINRVMILKLLNRDQETDYYAIETSETALDNPEILNALLLLKNGDREQIINNYR